MSNKLEQMNIRISENMKDRITEIAKKKNIKTSDFVRQTLEEAIEGKSQSEINELLITNFSNRETIILKAAAFIAQTDTGKFMADCLKIAMQVAKEFNLASIADPTKISREEREKQTMEINKEVSKRLQVSPKGNFLIHLLLVTYMGINYNEDIFHSMTPLTGLVNREMIEFLTDNKREE